jgi:hypothetical protein
MLSSLWALIAPWAGPAVVGAAKWLPSFGWIKPAVRALAWTAVLGAVLFLAYGVMKSRRDPVGEYVAVSEVNAKLLATQNRALISAAAAKDAIIATRDIEFAELEAELAALKLKMEASRAQSPDPDGVVYPADDPWLLDKRSRLP